MFEIVILEEAERYIVHLPRQQQNKVTAYLRRLETEGFNLRRPLADNLGHGSGLWELRPGRHRFLYFFHKRVIIVVAHAFLKKTDNIAQTEINLALKRKREYEEGGHEKA